MPTSPLSFLKATMSSFMTRRRTGGQLGPASSSDSITGSQKRRKRSPIGVPGPVIVSRSFSSFVSMQRHLPEIYPMIFLTRIPVGLSLANFLPDSRMSAEALPPRKAIACDKVTNLLRCDADPADVWLD